MERREHILKAAQELFARFGFRKTTMEDVAKAARIAKATLYYYFKSKENILQELIYKKGEELRRRLLSAIRDAEGPVEKLRAYGVTRFKYFRKLALYYSTLTQEYYQYLPFIEKERRDFNAFEIETLEGILREGIDQGLFSISDPRLYAFLLLQAMKGLELPIATGEALKYDGRTLEVEEVLELLLGVVLHGITRR
ncbi:MAG: TetR/AcrR family transcriptional regulator [Candidatus Latescibacterota bacterium]|nr:MAG: TetR/AcrR family transcriptional regulator [Candidatus Latescibacterota bacterium]